VDVGDLVRRLLPDAVAVVEGAVTDATDDLWPEEAAHVAGAVAKRRREFAAGRRFARRALAQLGMAPGALPVGPDRAPCWPPEVTGSITHTDRYCAVAVARRADIAGIGIDLETVTRFDLRLLSFVLSAHELDAHGLRTDRSAQQRLGGALFSAKEALYKCLNARAAVQLDFKDCAVALDPAAGRFEAELLIQAGPFAQGRRFPGRFGLAGELVATAMVLPPTG
jgi:4'-phosphopantetheinyl transferase EntD